MPAHLDVIGISASFKLRVLIKFTDGSPTTFSAFAVLHLQDDKTIRTEVSVKRTDSENSSVVHITRQLHQN